MLTCRLCHFDAELDDVAIMLPRGACICVRCFNRETDSTLRMPAGLRRELDAALADAERAIAAAAAAAVEIP
jgi:hypothetical protein